MATFKVIVQKQRNDGFWPVYIRITHNRGVKYIRTDKIVDSKGVDKKNREVKDPFVLQSCSARIAKFAELLNKVEIRKWSVHDVVAYLEKGTADICFSDYARKYHDEMYNDGHERNARNYELAYQHLERYAGSNKVMFSQLTTQFINGWIKALSKTARAKEMYPVCVRQIFKQALAEFNDYDNGMIRITTNPWLKVKIPSSDVPEKKAITMEEVRAFFAAPLPESDRVFPLPELGRDVAMMVMCLAGINTVDIYRLKKEDYHDGIIGYERAKTRKGTWNDDEHGQQVIVGEEGGKPVVGNFSGTRKLSQNRYAFSFEYKKDGWTVRSEYIHSTGKAFAKSITNFNDANAKDCNLNAKIGDKAQGVYGLVIAPLAQLPKNSRIDFKARYDMYQPNGKNNMQKTQYEAGLNFHIGKRISILTEYALVNDKTLAKHNYSMADAEVCFRF
jgi:hypothetical protein